MNPRIGMMVALVLMAGCVSESEHQAALDQIDHLTSQLFECRGQVTELQDTPHERLSRARQAEQDGNEEEAERELQQLVDRYPDSAEAQVAQAALSNLVQRRELLERQERLQRREEKERNRLGFRALPTSSRVEAGSVTVQVRDVQLADQWVFDRYQDSHHFIDAKRGQRYVIAEVYITSTVHNPRLPPIYVYRAEGGLLIQQARLDYRFERWQDNDAFTGNKPDPENDFVYTGTIPFTAGVELKEPYIYEPLFILVGNTGCFDRIVKEGAEPPVTYKATDCGGSLGLTLEGVKAHRYTLIKVLNEETL